MSDAADDLGARLDAAVAEREAELVAFAQALVREPSTLGDEEGAQRLVVDRLVAAGLSVERVTPTQDIAERDPLAGYPALSYAGRSCVIGRLWGTGGGRSLHLNGHIDVVPVERPERWTRDPWGGDLHDGRLWGRGAGDMKGAIAAYLIALEAVLSVGPLAGDITFSTVIEEECGGNGMHAVLDSGVAADACLIGEPTDLRIAYGGVGLIWFRLTAQSKGAHVGFAETEGPVDQIAGAVAALRELEAKVNGDAVDRLFFEATNHPYNLNLGEVAGGAWPSSVPVDVSLRGRFGFGRDIEPAQAQRLLTDAVAGRSPDVAVTFDGFRATAYAHTLDDDFATCLGAAHRAVHGAAPDAYVLTFTTDARQVPAPCLCYGPVAGNIHGTDEWVSVQSLKETALATARLIAAWSR